MWIRFISALCLSCRLAQIDPDMYERMLQERDKYKEATEMLGRAIEYIDSRVPGDREKSVSELKSRYAKFKADLANPPVEPIEYVGEVEIK